MKIAVISPSAKNLETISRILEEESPGHSITTFEGSLHKLRNVADQLRPDLMIGESMCRDVEELGPLEYVTMHYPKTTVMVMCSNQTPEFLINAMRAGIKEVLPSPVNREALCAAVARVESRLGATSPRPTGQVLAFIACKGGSGATFLATNLAYQLASCAKKVVMIDFNLQFGDAVLFVHDKKPATNLADVAHNVQRLDGSFLAASLVEVTPNFGILAAPEDPGQAMEVKPEHIDTLLNVAVSHYDFVVIDVGRILDAVTLRVLDQAGVIFPVLQMTLPFIRDANRLLAVFRSLDYPQEKIQPIVNRFEKNSDLALADIEHTLGMSDMRTIPNSYEAVAASVNRGIPIAQIARNNPVTRSLAEFAQSLMPKEEIADSWLGRLIKRA